MIRPCRMIMKLQRVKIFSPDTIIQMMKEKSGKQHQQLPSAIAESSGSKRTGFQHAIGSRPRKIRTGEGS